LTVAGNKWPAIFRWAYVAGQETPIQSVNQSINQSSERASEQASNMIQKA
jgi:hypothetical protein